VSVVSFMIVSSFMIVWGGGIASFREPDS
jgi:hypothetical protein